jgi:acyl-CoA reductase-like NAD-dependent aldehyde dehydrogenase
MAGRAQLSWKQTSFTDRRRVMRSLKKWLVENKDVCARVACRDSGKTRMSFTLLCKIRRAPLFDCYSNDSD